jgi:hypothetical protein
MLSFPYFERNEFPLGPTAEATVVIKVSNGAFTLDVNLMLNGNLGGS